MAPGRLMNARWEASASFERRRHPKKKATSGRGWKRGRETVKHVPFVMFRGCSWIKNFQVLAARWKGGRKGRDGMGGGHIYICALSIWCWGILFFP